jgi:LacI family transcriptional regulator
MNLKELAKELHLSISTVSKALRDSHEISESTKKIVIAKAKELNYHANPFASSLRKQKSKTIAVLIPEIANNFFSLVINGVEAIAQEKGYHVLIYLTHEDMKKEVAITKHLQNGRVDGIMISVSNETSDFNHLEELRKNDVSLVFFDRVVDNMNCPKITTDDYNSSFKATEHLIENGAKRIAFLSFSNTLSISNKRKNGYIDALKKHQIHIDEKLIIHCTNNDDANKLLIKNLLKRKNKPDAIFASVEKLVINCYEVCEELQINIPTDLKILSFSNLKTASFLHPSLTTITQPAYDIGRETAAILFKLIEKKGYNFIPENTILKSDLIKRNSTKKAAEIN